VNYRFFKIIVENFFGLFLSIKKYINIIGQYLTKMAIKNKTKSFGEQLRNLREGAGLSLKSVSEQLSIDTSLLAKIERNERQPTKQIIKQVACYYRVKEKELQNNFLSDQIAYKILDEEADLSVLKVAEEKVKYLKSVNNGR
jgi:transcriptional regulator with XRE-family HTH domain